jgi:hypothetical protein
VADTELAFCVTGWYFGREDLYAKLSKVESSSIYVISHQPRAKVPRWLFDYVPEENVFFEPNLGYDLGCYQQYLDRAPWRQHELFFFLQDDIEIRGLGFVDACRQLTPKHPLVGNGRLQEDPILPRRFPERYAHSTDIPGPDEAHRGIRTSFFCTTREQLELIESFEVFWDRYNIAVGFGNYSLVSTFSKWQKRLDSPDAFAWLSESYCESEWITELVRGGVGREPFSLGKLKKYTPDFYTKKVLRKVLTLVCRKKVCAYWRSGSDAPAVRWLGRIENFFSRSG